jgi:hypothetical protein
MMDFWGNLFEYVTYQVTGKLSEKPVKQSALSHYLRSMVLLDVKPSW